MPLVLVCLLLVMAILLSLPLLNVATTSTTTIKTAAAQELPDRLQNLLSELEVIEIVDHEISLLDLPQEESGDDCGDGSNSYRTFGGIKWRSYPVSYYIDTSGSRIDPSAAKRAVVAAFNEIDREEHPPGRFFSQVARYSDADIYVRWGELDGSGNGIAKAKFWYRTSTNTLVHAVIVFDRAERWDALSSLSCNGRSRSPFDIQNMAVHEIGHAIGLDHVRDIVLSMYPTAAPGETLKRSLGIGDQRGINSLY